MQFEGSARDAWEAEYGRNVIAERWPGLGPDWHESSVEDDLAAYSIPDEWMDDLEAMDARERRFVLGELAGHLGTLDEAQAFDEL